MLRRLSQFFNPAREAGAAELRGLPWRMFWVGLAVRLLYLTLAHSYRLRGIDDHFQFGWEVGRIARALVAGRGYADPFNGHSGPTAWSPPLYPLLLAGVFKVFGVYTRGSAWVILAIDSVFNAAAAPAVYELGWRCFGRDARGLKVALWAGWLWALYPAAMQYAVHWVWETTLSTFLFAWVLVLALRLRGVGSADAPKPGTRGWVGFGLVWGLIALSNSSLLAVFPFCVGWVLWPAVREHRVWPAMRHAVLAGVCVVLVVSPWVVRNWVTLHAFVPMRANLGAELYQSELPMNNGFPWGGTLPLAETDPEFQRYARVGEVAFSKAQGERAKAMIAARPGQYAGWVVKRVYFFWFGVPHPTEGTWKSLLVEAGRELNFSVLSVAGLLGLGLALYRRVPGAWLFLWCFLVAPSVYYLVTVQARFRHPLEPVMTVLIVYLFQSAEPRRAGQSGRVV